MSRINNSGYRVIKGERLEHRVVAEEVLGKSLPPKAVIHHVNEIKTDNRKSNLVICQNEAYHKLLHTRQRVVDLGGHPDTHAYCSHHKAVHLSGAFGVDKGRVSGLSHRCKAGDAERQRGVRLNAVTH